jgi:hypothetical protein
MKRWLAVTLMVGIGSTPLVADVKVTSTTTFEGPMTAMMGGVTPTMVTHIKGQKARIDVSMGDQLVSTILDVQAKQFIVLNGADKTAQILSPDSIQTPQGPMPMPKIDATVKPTGQSKVIEGARCDEQAVAMIISMAEMVAQMPPQAAEMMKDVKVRVNGSLWVAKSGPGVAEYVAFQTESTKQNLSMLARMLPGLGGGFDKVMDAMSGASGLPYLTELRMQVEGGGDMAGLLKQFGDMKFTNRVTGVSTDTLSDDLFTVPSDYKIVTK